MWSYESESAHILLFKILSLISRIKKKLCIHHECEVFPIKWAIVDGYKVIRKIHNDAKKVSKMLFTPKISWCRKSISIFQNSVAPSFCTNSWNFLRNLYLKMFVRHQRLLTVLLKCDKYHESLGRRRKTRAQN